MLTIAEAAKLVGVSPGTLRLWESQGLIAPARDGAGRRVFDDAEVERVRKVAWWRRVRGLNAPAIRRVLEDDDYSSIPGRRMDSAKDSAAQDSVPPIRTMRRRAGLTLREVGERSGLSVSFLSAIERGVARASPTALARIRAALQDSAVVDQQPPHSHCVHQIGTGKRIDVAPGIAYEWLSGANGVMEPQVVCVQPGARSEGTYQHDGEEFLMVLHGTFELGLGDELQTLGERDSIHFESSVPHHWRNPGDIELEVLWVTTERAVWRGRGTRMGPTRGSHR